MIMVYDYTALKMVLVMVETYVELYLLYNNIVNDYIERFSEK